MPQTASTAQAHISTLEAVGPSGPGALAGYEARCAACAFVARSSLQSIARQDAYDHWRYMATKDQPASGSCECTIGGGTCQYPSTGWGQCDSCKQGYHTHATAARAPKPPTWATVACKHSHCIYRGTIHAESYHTARDGARFDRMA